MARSPRVLSAVRRLAGLAALAVLVGGLLWAWQLEPSLEMSRRVTLVMLGAAGCLAIAGFLARAAASRGPARADDSLFSAALLGGAALVIGWLLGMPDAAMPSRTALRAVQTIAAVLSVLTIGIAGVGVVLAAWANRLRDYVLGQILIQSQVLPVLACLVTIWIGVSAQLRQSVPP